MDEMIELPKKGKSAKRTKRPARKKVRARKKPKQAYAAAHYRSLLAILMFLYMLKLIDDRAFNRIKEVLYPRRAVSRRGKGKPRRSSRRRMKA
jgi:hypothetical protein